MTLIKTQSVGHLSLYLTLHAKGYLQLKILVVFTTKAGPPPQSLYKLWRLDNKCTLNITKISLKILSSLKIIRGFPK